MFRTSEFEPVRDHYSLDRWSNNTPVGTLANKLFSRSRLDRVRLGQTLFWVAEQIPSAIIEAWATGGVMLVARIPELVMHMYDLGRIEGLDCQEIQAMVLAQASITHDFQTFNQFGLWSACLPNLETFFDVFSGTKLVKDNWESGADALYRYSSAAKLGDAVELANVRRAFVGSVAQLGYGVATKLAGDWINANLDWDGLDAEIERSAFLWDLHSQLLANLAAQLAKDSTELVQIWQGSDTPQNRARLEELFYNYGLTYYKYYRPVFAELYGVHLANLERIRANAQPPIMA